MSPVRLKRRRIVTDLAGAQRVLVEDTPLPAGWQEGEVVAPTAQPTVAAPPTPVGDGDPTVAVQTPATQPTVAGPPASGASTPDLDDMTVPQLEDEASRRNVDIDTIEGTGQNGAVLKADLVSALRADEAR